VPAPRAPRPASWHARVNQQALIDRAMRAHKWVSRASVVAAPVADKRAERTSVDSVISLLVEPALADSTDGDAGSSSDERSPMSPSGLSPTSVMGGSGSSKVWSKRAMMQWDGAPWAVPPAQTQALFGPAD